MYQSSRCENVFSASSRFVVPTCYSVLADAKQMKATKVPLALVGAGH